MAWLASPAPSPVSTVWQRWWHSRRWLQPEALARLSAARIIALATVVEAGAYIRSFSTAVVAVGVVAWLRSDLSAASRWYNLRHDVVPFTVGMGLVAYRLHQYAPRYQRLGLGAVTAASVQLLAPVMLSALGVQRPPAAQQSAPEECGTALPRSALAASGGEVLR